MLKLADITTKNFLDTEAVYYLKYISRGFTIRQASKLAFAKTVQALNINK